MRHLLVILAVASLTACASNKPPPPKAAQDEEPIRTQEEIARDQASSSGPTAVPSPADDPRCKQHPKAPGCAKKSGGPFDNSARRNPFVYDESGHSNPGNPANQSR